MLAPIVAWVGAFAGTWVLSRMPFGGPERRLLWTVIGGAVSGALAAGLWVTLLRRHKE